MKQVCLLHLDEGKAKTWEKNLKEKIVEKFVRDSEELQDAVKSKEGFWSTIKGFFQWLYWIVFDGSWWQLYGARLYTFNSCTVQ